jgi:hypothetical protein
MAIKRKAQIKATFCQYIIFLSFPKTTQGLYFQGLYFVYVKIFGQ